MTSRDFCYWLQGYFEIQGTGTNEPLTPAQVGTIRNHLHMVFVHEIDPSFPKAQQEALDKAHGPKPSPGVDDHMFGPPPAPGAPVARC